VQAAQGDDVIVVVANKTGRGFINRLFSEDQGWERHPDHKRLAKWEQQFRRVLVDGTCAGTVCAVMASAFQAGLRVQFFCPVCSDIHTMDEGHAKVFGALALETAANVLPEHPTLQ
jgi:hypothetical protein